ncbi:MAG: TIGR00153 family protein [Pseudomonadota bacterium]|nr:TIGR00153 family protein [Pseudomonadota bacterium]
MPTTINFKKLLGGSPFPPMKKHMKLSAKCVEEIPKMLQALFDEDETALLDARNKVFELESQADQIFDSLSSQLPESKYLPVHRHDLLAVLREQESIADTAQDIAGLLLIHLDVSNEVREPLLTLANKSVETVHKALEVIKTLDALVETGFKGPDVDRVHQLIDEVSKSEDGADMLGIDLVDSLYKHHKDKDPLSTMFTYQLTRWLGELADHAELVGSRMRLLVGG